MRNTALLLLLFFSLHSSAQPFTEIPGFGKVDKSELEMTDCPFDKNAPAMFIFNEAESVFHLNLNSISSPFFEQTECRVRIKIFNRKGFEFANVRIRYYSENKDISIKSLSAQTYNLDASGNIVITKLDKNTVFDKARE